MRGLFLASFNKMTNIVVFVVCKMTKLYDFADCKMTTLLLYFAPKEFLYAKKENNCTIGAILF